MAEYYLISQLPSLDGISEATPVPITEERFLELCSRYLSPKARKEVEKLSLLPSLDAALSPSPLVQAWNAGERDLRLALGKLRAEKMEKPFPQGNKNFPVDLLRAVGTAMDMESPLEAERFLSQYRLNFLETLRPMDNFSEDFVYYYGLKLKLLLRTRQFDTQQGEVAYRNIYNSILNGD